MKAIERGSINAHFSLAVLHLEGRQGTPDIPQCVFHLAMASALGHTRALNFLAHALFDGDSWLHDYGRSQHEKMTSLDILGGHPNITNNITYSTISRPLPNATGHWLDQMSQWLTKSKNKKNTTSQIKQNLTEAWKYDGSRPLHFYVGAKLVHMPHPLGSYDGSCEAALVMMKYLSEMSYRPNDLMKAALIEYSNENYWKSLELYEEAAGMMTSRNLN